MSIIDRLKTVLRTKPRKFQIEGIRRMEQLRGRALLADDMGLGKTLQVLSLLALHPKMLPAMIVCPSNAKFGWAGQLEQHFKIKIPCQVLEGQKPSKITTNGVVVVNYEILSYWQKEILKWCPKTLVVDECHYIKTRSTKRTKACRYIARKAKYFIPMSGTPVVNRPVEFYPTLNMLLPNEFHDFWEYAFSYCHPKRAFRGVGWNFSGACNTNELHERVKGVMIRRMKKDVLTELPPRSIVPIWTEISNRGEYTHARDDFLDWYVSKIGVESAVSAQNALPLVRIGKLREIVAQGKIKAAVQWIDDFLEETDEKLVVYVYHRKIFQELEIKYKGIAAIGGKAGIQREREIQKFQTDKKTRLFIASISADSEAITLTAASNMLVIELGWTPGGMEQMMDRIYRIGQTADRVMIYYMVGRGTIDEYMWRLLKKKRKIVKEVLDGVDNNGGISMDQIIEGIKQERKQQK